MDAGACAVCLCLALAAGAAQAQLLPVSTGQLQFGKFVAAGAGSVTVTPTGVRMARGGVFVVASTAAPAQFQVIDNDTQHAGRAWSVLLPADGAAALTSGTRSMALSAFTSSRDGALNGNGALSIGATLQVAPGQPPGNYTGYFQLVLEYQ